MFPKIIDITDFSASECSDIGLMLELCYMFLAKCEEPRISLQKDSSNEKGLTPLSNQQTFVHI